MAFSFHVQVTGADEMVDKLRSVFSDIAPDMEGVLVEEAETIMAASKEIVPVDQGILRASGGIYDKNVTAESVSVTFGYGGAASSYAVVQHETPPDVYSHAPGKSWKYLEFPVMAAIEGMGERLGSKLSARIARRFAGGGADGSGQTFGGN